MNFVCQHTHISRSTLLFSVTLCFTCGSSFGELHIVADQNLCSVFILVCVTPNVKLILCAYSLVV